MPSPGLPVTANYLKASPSSQFGTRELVFISVSYAGADTTPTIANSLFSQAVRALQQTAEVWAVFTPTTGAFNAIISTDSQWDGVGTGTGAVLPGDASYAALETALAAGITGTPTVTVTNVAGFVAPFHG